MNKQMFGLIAGLALFTLACQSFNVQGIDLPGFSPVQVDNAQPQSRFIEAQTVKLVQNQAVPAVYVSDGARPVAYQAQIPLLYFFTRHQMFRPVTLRTRLPEEVIRASVGQQLIIDTYHTDPEALESVEILINNQPVNVEQPDRFPSSLMDVQICADYAWAVVNQTLTRLCTDTGLIKTNRAPIDIFSTNARRVTLVITPQVAGTYQLTLAANDTQGASSRLTRQIVVE